MKHPLHKMLNAVYGYYTVATTTPFLTLYTDLLILARDNGADVFNALDVMDNSEIFNTKELIFGKGDGNLNYYVFNWKCTGIEPSGVGLILV